MSRSCFDQAFPARRVGGIDGVENKRNSFFPLGRLWHTKRNRGVTDFVFRANEALAYSCGRKEKRRCNSRGINTKNCLQHQRSTRGCINRRMRADEKKFQSFVGEMI